MEAMYLAPQQNSGYERTRALLATAGIRAPILATSKPFATAASVIRGANCCEITPLSIVLKIAFLCHCDEPPSIFETGGKETNPTEPPILLNVPIRPCGDGSSAHVARGQG